jgi:heat shock protein HtpX
MLILAPIAAMLIQMSISRTREFSADAASAKYTGTPDELIDGLRKLERGVAQIPMDAQPATAHMFIVNPFRSGAMMRLFSTHPSTEDRASRSYAVRAGALGYENPDTAGGSACPTMHTGASACR